MKEAQREKSENTDCSLFVKEKEIFGAEIKGGKTVYRMEVAE